MNIEWLECVRWCHSNEDIDVVDAHIDALMELSRHSTYATPILTRIRDIRDRRAAGYVILYPGALASIGNLRCDASDDKEQDLLQMANLAKELFSAAFDQGAEMIQAISLLIADRISNDVDSAFIPIDTKRDLMLKEAGMIPMAKLVQMECMRIQDIPRLLVSESSWQLGQIDFIPHHTIPSEGWGKLVESTYVETLDVPELNGLRSVENTLAGYASTVCGVPQSWWIVRCNNTDIGCLLLAPTTPGCCELTYVGLQPEWRGKGISRIIMNFARDWALGNAPDGITLAVDLRNLPAIRLYQACGFTTQRFVQAWICFPNMPQSDSST
ncbi:MAG: GNAT family N-acetyltransferase [Planctomycetota bacterium]|nr:GNAT family N-acetyltransferase [Planctomycetota bacterium]